MLTSVPSQKQCFKCEETKPIHDFYRHKEMADGHLNKCKECTKRDVRKHRHENPHVREYDRVRSREDHRRDARREYGKMWSRQNRHKKNAEQMARRAIKRGDLIRQPCEQCQAEPVHAHHDDYSKPLEVRWLCPLCHRRWHADNDRRTT